MQLALLLHDESEAIFECIFCPSLELAHHLSPLLLALVLLDDVEEEEVFLLGPGSLLEVGVEVTVPMLTALLGTAVNFMGVGIEEVELLGN